MKKLRVIIVDDEKLARTYLADLLSPYEDLDLVAECADGFEAVKACAQFKPDVIFLDVQMPKLDGFEVLELLDPVPHVVFVTAFDDYAIDAFGVHAVDYLLKPFSPERLAQAIEHVRQRSSAPQQLQSLLDDRGADGRLLQRVAVRDGSAVHLIAVGDLDYVSAQDDYIELHSGQRSFLKHQTLTSLEKRLNPEDFVRIHRSTLVNLHKVERIEAWSKDSKIAIMKDGTRLRVSRSGYQKLRQSLDRD